MSDTLNMLELEFNPFEPAASGAPLGSELVPPTSLADRVRDLLDRHRTGPGVKAIVVVGEYGTGKTCLLQCPAERGGLDGHPDEGGRTRLRAGTGGYSCYGE